MDGASGRAFYKKDDLYGTKVVAVSNNAVLLDVCLADFFAGDYITRGRDR
jgi:hypothetical protein